MLLGVLTSAKLLVCKLLVCENKGSLPVRPLKILRFRRNSLRNILRIRRISLCQLGLDAKGHYGYPGLLVCGQVGILSGEKLLGECGSSVMCSLHTGLRADAVNLPIHARRGIDNQHDINRLDLIGLLSIARDR